MTNIVELTLGAVIYWCFCACIIIPFVLYHIIMTHPNQMKSFNELHTIVYNFAMRHNLYIVLDERLL